MKVCRSGLLCAAAIWLTVAAACSRAADRQRAPASDTLVAQNNRGVGLMGQFDYEGARTVFASLAASSPDRVDLQINLAIATLNRQEQGNSAAALQMVDQVLAARPHHIRMVAKRCTPNDRLYQQGLRTAGYSHGA